eukprot:3946214-Alexandrium_andersonii.AAC.1
MWSWRGRPGPSEPKPGRALPCSTPQVRRSGDCPILRDGRSSPESLAPRGPCLLYTSDAADDM